MKLTNSYDVEIKRITKLPETTAKIYQDAFAYCVGVFDVEWSNIMSLVGKFRNTYCRNLIHSTKGNVAKYSGFDKKFYKFPSYLLTALISDVLGYLSAYHSQLENWESSNKTGKKPRLQTNHRRFPTFIKGNTYDDNDIDNDFVQIKLFVDGDWKYVKVQLKHTDMQYLRKHYFGKKLSNPTLEKRFGKWFLRFAIEDSIPLNNTNITDLRILQVDLGINTDATCSVMTSDGTIHGRKFVNFPCDKDRIWHCLNKIKKIQQKYGLKGSNRKKMWRYCKSLNDELARKIAKAIVDYAIEMNCHTIVFEHLDFQGKKHGNKAQKLTMWKKQTIQKLVENKAHWNGMRISHICAWGTSKLAYDGSGPVLRGKDAGFKNNKLCKFQNGKVYSCDLSASYNIGSRFFIREIQKSVPEKEWSRIVANVPSCGKRTLCTYNTLLELNNYLKAA